MNQERSRATEWEREGRQQGKVHHSPAQLPLVCGLVFIAMDRSGGRSWGRFGIFSQQEGSEGVMSFPDLPGC